MKFLWWWWWWWWRHYNQLVTTRRDLRMKPGTTHVWTSPGMSPTIHNVTQPLVVYKPRGAGGCNLCPPGFSHFLFCKFMRMMAFFHLNSIYHWFWTRLYILGRNAASKQKKNRRPPKNTTSISYSHDRVSTYRVGYKYFMLLFLFHSSISTILIRPRFLNLDISYTPIYLSYTNLFIIYTHLFIIYTNL